MANMVSEKWQCLNNNPYCKILSKGYKHGNSGNNVIDTNDSY